MTNLLRSAVLVGLAPILSACGGDAAPPPPANASPKAGVHDIDRGGMDLSVAPGDDFFRYANGTWLKKTEIPPDRSSVGTWSTLFDMAQERTHALLEAASRSTAAAGSDERKMGDYYASYMDEKAIEAKGITPLRVTTQRSRSSSAMRLATRNARSRSTTSTRSPGSPAHRTARNGGSARRRSTR